jgi:hypothetical protein
MSKFVSVVVMILVWTGSMSAQDPQQRAQVQSDAAQTAQEQPVRIATHHRRASQSTTGVNAASVNKSKQVPSIIQSELDRSRSEASQTKAVPTQPAPRPVAQADVWPLFVSLGAGALVTCGVLLYFFYRKNKPSAAVSSAPIITPQCNDEVPALPQQRTFAQEAVEFDDDRVELREVTSASPYVFEEDERELPEAALTMNLMNKKRETKKDVILEVMKRVQRKEKPQMIAEQLRIGIGEVHLAMTLAKLKK